MLKVVLNQKGGDAQRRKMVFDGALLFYSASPASSALCDWAKQTVREAFGDLDPEHAQEHLSVQQFVSIVGALKTRFTNAAETKRLLKAYLVEMGVDPEVTYFDVPRLRVVPHSDYLSSGVSYAYKAHRDIWYSSPTSQLNWWMPVWDVTTERTMAFFPNYWDKQMENTSADFDYGEWTRVGRALAASQIGQDTRKHPLPLHPVTTEDEFRYATSSGEAVVFSACHLHATVPNTSDKTRFSLDFRTVNLADIRNLQGGLNVDCKARGSTLGDFLRVDDLQPIELDNKLETA
jgi:hypothetical protein